jgi:hypothetical protein
VGASVSAENLLAVICDSGYFRGGSFDPSRLRELLEDRIGISCDRAIRLLVEKDFVAHEYDPAVSGRDALDAWRLVLTENGARHSGR